LFVDDGIALKVLDSGRRMVLVSVGKEVGTSDLFHAHFGDKRGRFFIACFVTEYVGFEWLSSVEILRFDLHGPGAGKHQLHIFLLLVWSLQNNYFLVLY